MTPAKIWTFVRWPIAIVALLALANYAYPRFVDSLGTLIEFDASGSILDTATASESALPTAAAIPTTTPTLEPGTGPVTDGVGAPVADFFVNDTVADIDNDALILSDDSADRIIVAFDIPPGDPGCMSAMTLGMTVDEVLSPVEIGVFASTVGDAADIVDNEQVDGDLRATTTSMATALVEAPGRLTLDVLAGFQSYFTQDFEPGRPFVLTIAPTVPVESQGGLRMVSSNQEDADAPSLSWVGTPGCPVGADGATPAPTPTQ